MLYAKPPPSPSSDALRQGVSGRTRPASARQAADGPRRTGDRATPTRPARSRLARPAARAAPNRDVSVFPDIGTGHDREDLFFREDLAYLFDSNPSPGKKSSRSPDRTKSGVPPVGHGQPQRSPWRAAAFARQHQDEGGGRIAPGGKRDHGGEPPATCTRAQGDATHPSHTRTATPLIGFLSLPSPQHQGARPLTPTPAPGTSGCEPRPREPVR
jgi:hypothetical protein